MKIVDYIIITATTPIGLPDKVKIKIAEGYQPFGNIIYGSGCFSQPMVKYSA